MFYKYSVNSFFIHICAFSPSPSSVVVTILKRPEVVFEPLFKQDVGTKIIDIPLEGLQSSQTFWYSSKPKWCKDTGDDLVFRYSSPSQLNKYWHKDHGSRDKSCIIHGLFKNNLLTLLRYTSLRILYRDRTS